ncbi:MAG: hypothetical protein LBE12_14425 [Planctomycetaceae bacterium]|jgi:hypothetical protein|nr:hypothetical protein [Planctomycetaceae bacterium]
MPFQPGIFFSIVLLVLCLGINLTYYPKVHEMFHEPTKEVAAVSSEPPVLKENKTNSLALPSFPQNQIKKENSSQSSAPVNSVKTSKVNKPIQPDPFLKQPKEKEKNSQTFEKKPDTFQIKSNPDKLNVNLKESRKEEKIIPKQSEPKQPEPKQLEPKQPEPKQLEPKQSEPKQLEPKQPEPKQLEPKQSEPKQSEPKQSEPKQSEPKQSEPKQLESKQSESKQPESKQQSFSASTVSPLASSNTSSFLPIVPSSLEKEYWESAGQFQNQLAIFAPQKTVPELQLRVPILKPSEPTPAYANVYREPKQDIPKQDIPKQDIPKQDILPSHDKTDPVKKNKPEPPTFIWETIDSALERPLMYETP